MLDLTDNKGRKDIKSMTLEEVTAEAEGQLQPYMPFHHG